jgi:hypothetical protein
MDRFTGLRRRGRAESDADSERETRGRHPSTEGGEQRRLRNETHVSPPFSGDQLMIV